VWELGLPVVGVNIVELRCGKGCVALAMTHEEGKMPESCEQRAGNV